MHLRGKRKVTGDVSKCAFVGGIGSSSGEVARQNVVGEERGGQRGWRREREQPQASAAEAPRSRLDAWARLEGFNTVPRVFIWRLLKNVKLLLENVNMIQKCFDILKR